MLADMQERVQRIATTIRERAPHCATEEATKMSLIVPVLQDVLGYDCHDPRQVIPEYTADFGTKKAEKVDYALMRNGEPVVLVEAKTAGSALDAAKSQIYRYFSTTGDACRTAILTNGTLWHFYGDLDARNKLDRSPCFTFDFEAYDPDDVQHLQIACQSKLDDPERIDRMRKLRYRRKIGIWLDRQSTEPDDDFVMFLAKQIHEGTRTKNVIATFKAIIPDALGARRNRAIGDRLRRRAISDQNETAVKKTIEPIEPMPPARTHLVVTLDGTEYSSQNKGWYGPQVLKTALDWIWKTPAGRTAIERTVGDDPCLRKDAESFPRSAKTIRIGTDGPYVNHAVNNSVKIELLQRICARLPEKLKNAIQYELKSSDAPDGETADTR